MLATWRAVPERGSRAAIDLITSLTLAFGRNATHWLLYPICLYFYAFVPRARRASSDYLARVLGREPGTKDVLRHFHTFAATLHDRIFFVQRRFDDFDVVVHGGSEVDRLLGRGRGCLVLGSHLGSFEIIGALGRQAQVPRVRLVMYRRNAGHLSAAMAALNPELARQVIALGEPDSMVQLETALSEGDFAGMLADRVLDGDEAVSIPFLGQPARFPRGPFQVAAVLKRPLVLMVGLYRGGNRYDVHFERLADMTDAGRDERATLIDRAMRRYVERLEHYCRAAPFNWFNFYDYWG